MANQHRIGINPKLQSPYVYLQAAGSDGADLTAEGIHLRWAFQRSLGDGHLAKGELSGATGPFPSVRGFNREKDFVHIYKAPYSDKLFGVSIPLGRIAGPIVESGNTRSWTYAGFLPVAEDDSIATDVVLRFTDSLLYDLVRQSVDPAVDGAIPFLAEYEGTIEVEAVGKHMLLACIDFEPNPRSDGGEPSARGESISCRDRLVDDFYVSCRNELLLSKGNSLCFTCEDIRFVRFRYQQAIPVRLRIQTYQDYTVGVFLHENLNWQHLGGFSLSLDTALVQDRLHNAPHGDVDRRWPKFNEANPNTGLFTVNVANYLQHWGQPADGMREALVRYLQLSQTDPQANDILIDPATQPTEAALDVSYLDLFNIVSQDYHVARMLGMGYIDNDQATRKDPTVYLMEYVTEASLEGETGRFVTHYYMTPPIHWRLYRLPPAPVLAPPRYGLYHEPVEGQVRLLTDDQGYTRYEPSRYINLDRESFPFEGPLPPFWSGNPGYCLCLQTVPAQYGVEYRKLGEPLWRRPEISHNREDLDPAGVPETVPIPELEENPVFTHRETEEGVHQYAMYSINWFSRVSVLSNIAQTDDTRFPRFKNLLPPANLAVQLIQKENPLIFTTAAEQNRLLNLPGSDKTLVRLTFDWDQAHNIAYQFADSVAFFFRQQPPLNIQGILSNFSDLPDGRVRALSGPGNIASQDPALVRQPTLPAALKPRFVGASLTYETQSFVIDDIQIPDPSGDNPIFILNKIVQRRSIEVSEDEFITVDDPVGPQTPGKPFLVVENTNRPESWDSRLERTVFLEPFHEAYWVTIRDSANNDRAYRLKAVDLVATDTRLTVSPELTSNDVPLGNLVYRRKARILSVEIGNSLIRVDRDLTLGAGGLGPGQIVTIFGSRENAGSYTALVVAGTGDRTEITLDPPLPQAVVSGYLGYQKEVPIKALDVANGFLFLTGNLINELKPPRQERRLEDDGSTTEYVIGGLDSQGTVTEFQDVDGAGVTIPGSHTGLFELLLNDPLPDHVDPGVDWYRGSVRILEDAAQFPPLGSVNYRPPEMKVLNIWEIDRSGANLRLVVFDPSFDPGSGFNPQEDYMPIVTGAGVAVNVHPGYRLYLTADTVGGNNFAEPAILPAVDAGSKQTLMAARALDTSGVDCASALTTPVVLLAQELRDPVPPAEPAGPLFATRPDYYGKASYTFDVAVSNPFALIFYRGADRAILDALYRQETVAQILADLAALESPDADYHQDRWHDLANCVTGGDHLFPRYLAGGYSFPIPDNGDFVLPNQDPAIVVRPFAAGNTPPGQMLAAVRTAVAGAFVPLTAQPLIYRYLNTGTITSSRPPVIRNANGEPLLPADPGYDPWPMAALLPGGNAVRFTDYNLDGASINRYFYFAVELSNRMAVSDRSPVAGPITLVNSYPPEQPQIRKLIVRTYDAREPHTPAVVFELNQYLATEQIARYVIYRTRKKEKSTSVRSMTRVKTLEVGTEVRDDFEGMAIPPYGEDLYYRVVALRRFTDEQGRTQYAPSKASVCRCVRLVDTQIPPAPILAFGSDPPGGPLATLGNPRLTWDRTAWNPTYHIYKMGRLGTWSKIASLANNDETITLDLAPLVNGPLNKRNSSGATIFHRFRVVTENSSGLLSTEDRPLSV